MGIDIRHCPTLLLLADFFTKPLLGSLFQKFRDFVLGYKQTRSRHLILSTKEHVENNEEKPLPVRHANSQCEVSDKK